MHKSHEIEVALKRGKWPEFIRGDVRHWDWLADLRKVSPFATEVASLQNVLRFAKVDGHKSWLVVEENTKLPTFAEARRMDGKKFVLGNGDKIKVKSLPGSTKRLVGLGNVMHDDKIALVEGAGDLLAAFHFALVSKNIHRVMPVAALGASTRIKDEELWAFTGRRVRIFAHDDEAGIQAAQKWAEQIRPAADAVEIIKLMGGDLNDLAAEGHSDESLMKF